MSKPDLGDLLAKVLPSQVKLTVRHVSSTPTPCIALFAAPPGESPEPTFCENHFLSISIDREGQELIIFGIEVLVYSTAHLTTIFISKADSTGYLHLLKLGSKVSLLRLISTTFLSYLAQTRQRPGVRLVLSLFARAQNQYLFPGSVENPGKHVLDDRGLIKWWCRVVDPILHEHEPESTAQDKGLLDQATESARSSATAFLIVPGCDRFETRGFFPPTARFDNNKEHLHHPRWVNGYPVRQLCRNPNAPPRCLVPRFPDDPKTRFLVDLDDELPEQTGTGGSSSAGQWRSVRSLEQFWEMMSFRQECSAGRLVGFLWLVINPPGLVNSIPMSSSSSRTVAPGHQAQNNVSLAAAEVSEERSTAAAKETVHVAKPEQHQPSTPPESQKEEERRVLVSDQQPPPPLPPSSLELHLEVTITESNNPFSWPEAGRGHVVLNDADYKAAIDFLIDKDFETEELAVASTKAWTEKVAALADELVWGEHVVGKKVMEDDDAVQPSETTNVLNIGLVRKRKKADTENDQANNNNDDQRGTETTPEAEPKSVPRQQPQPSGVNVLNASLIKKKKKT